MTGLRWIVMGWIFSAALVDASAQDHPSETEQAARQAERVERAVEAVEKRRREQLGWVLASEAFGSASSDFIDNRFVDTVQASWYAEQSVMAFSNDECPDGWHQLTDDVDGEPLYYAFGLFVDGEGNPRSEYVRMPVCVKK